LLLASSEDLLKAAKVVRLTEFRDFCWAYLLDEPPYNAVTVGRKWVGPSPGYEMLLPANGLRLVFSGPAARDWRFAPHQDSQPQPQAEFEHEMEGELAEVSEKERRKQEKRRMDEEGEGDVEMDEDKDDDSEEEEGEPAIDDRKEEGEGSESGVPDCDCVSMSFIRPK
jgi:hypothetical protein